MCPLLSCSMFLRCQTHAKVTCKRCRGLGKACERHEGVGGTCALCVCVAKRYRKPEKVKKRPIIIAHAITAARLAMMPVGSGVCSAHQLLFNRCLMCACNKPGAPCALHAPQMNACVKCGTPNKPRKM